MSQITLKYRKILYHYISLMLFVFTYAVSHNSIATDLDFAYKHIRPSTQKDDATLKKLTFKIDPMACAKKGVLGFCDEWVDYAKSIKIITPPQHGSISRIYYRTEGKNRYGYVEYTHRNSSSCIDKFTIEIQDLQSFTTQNTKVILRCDIQLSNLPELDNTVKVGRTYPLSTTPILSQNLYPDLVYQFPDKTITGNVPFITSIEHTVPHKVTLNGLDVTDQFIFDKSKIEYSPFSGGYSGYGSAMMLPQSSCGTFTYTAHYPGISYEESDISLLSITKDFNIEVTDCGPSFNGQALITDEDTSVTVLPSSNVQGSASLEFITQPLNGTVTLNPNNYALTYTPHANYCGADTFTATLTDDSGTSKAATFPVYTTCVYDPPFIGSGQFSGLEDTLIHFYVHVWKGDIENGSMKDVIYTKPPSHGTVSIIGRNQTYTPDPNYCGQDEFEVKFTTTSGAESNIATVGIDVTCVVDIPVLNDKTVPVIEDTPITFDVSHDLDGGAISDRLIDSLPSNGAAIWVNNQLKYTPNANFCGSDSFTASITTQAGKSSPATFTMNVSCVVDKPVLNGKTVSVVEDTPISFGVSHDLDGGAISDRHIDSQPSNGVATWVNNQLKYTPSADFCGSDSFTASITTQGGQSSPATFSMNVSCVIDAAVITDINATVVEDENVILPTPRIELDGGSVAQYLITTNVQHGQAFWQGGNLHYNPSTDYCGIDQFYYQVRTEAGLSNIAKAHLVVSCVNDAPTLVLTNKITFNIATGEHHVDYHVLDVDDNTVSAAISGLPAFIKHSFNAKQGRFTINESGQLAGEYLISVNVSDGQYGDEGFITIRIEDNRPINITQPKRTTLAATQIIRHTDNEPTNALKAVNITNIMGELITGNIAITVSASAGSISSEVAGKRLNPGSSVTFDYTVNEPGVIEVFVKPEREGTLSLSLSTDVNQ